MNRIYAACVALGAAFTMVAAGAGAPAAAAPAASTARAPRPRAGSAPIRVMSFNVRYSAAHDGINAWDRRRDRFFREITRFSPDLIGFQEVLADQRADIAHRLRGFAFSGVAREDGRDRGEWALIGFRTRRFTLLDHGDFWLSEHPDVPGSKSWDAGLTRICSWVRLRMSATGRVILYANTHLDNSGPLSRQHAAELIAARLPQLAGGAPVVLTGDFNATEDEPPYHVLVRAPEGGAVRWIDSYREVHPDRSPDEASFHGFKGTTVGSRIDFILHTPEFTAIAAAIDRDGGRDGVWPSDHYPVTAVLRLN